MRGEVAPPRFFLMSGKARQKEKEEEGWGKSDKYREKKEAKKKKVYTSSPKRATVVIPRVARLKRERRKGGEGKETKEGKEREREIQALNGSEKSAKSVGIYSTNASAQHRAFTTFFFLYLLQSRTRRITILETGNHRGHYRNSNFVCTRSLRTKSDTIWTSF